MKFVIYPLLAIPGVLEIAIIGILTAFLIGLKLKPDDIPELAGQFSSHAKNITSNIKPSKDEEN